MNSSRNFLIQGIYRDILYHQNGQIKYDSGWKSNLIVENARKLLAAFLKNDVQKHVVGIKYLAVGRGNPEWDGTQKAAVPKDYELYDKNFFKVTNNNLKIDFWDASNRIPSGPTMSIQITATIGKNEPTPTSPTPTPPHHTNPISQGIILHETNYPLREFGLFGEYEGVDFMIDYVIHPVINKVIATDILVRTIRLTL